MLEEAIKRKVNTILLYAKYCSKETKTYKTTWADWFALPFTKAQFWL
jgi:hypothetical protein